MAGVAACSVAQSGSVSYSVLLKNDGHTWCAYKDSAAFQSEAAAEKPIASARVTYLSNKMTELTYQVEAESGDWIVIDKYTIRNEDVVLQRANLMAQENLQVIQEVAIQGEKVGAFRVVSVTTLDGKKVELPSIDLPSVPVETNLLTLPFVQAVAEIRNRSIGKLCKRVN
jgi:hypothetical protein